MNKKVLICDDQELICQVLSRFLRNKGFDVSLASTGQECLQKVSAEIFDAIFLDIGIPDMDGITLAKKLSVINHRAQFIFMSGQVSEESLHGQGLPEYSFFKKPFSLHAVLQMLQVLQTKHVSRVLVVDDQDFLRELLCDYLRQKGFEIREARNGQEALEMTRQHSFDSILMDVRMPQLDGLLALKQMKSDGNQTPVILMSGFGDVNSLEDALALGARSFLPKPFKLEAASNLLAEIE